MRVTGRGTIFLVNPNANSATTEAMVAIARRELARMKPELQLTIEGRTARAGPMMIIDATALERSAEQVGALVQEMAAASSRPAGVIVAAFGDPGLALAQRRFPGRAVGIGSASLIEAAAGRRRFSVATTTPGLVDAIASVVAALGLGDHFAGTRLTRSDPLTLAADPQATVAELGEAVDLAATEDGAEAVVIGGGPLAEAARVLAARAPVPLIEPVPAAVRALVAAIGKL